MLYLFCDLCARSLSFSLHLSLLSLSRFLSFISQSWAFSVCCFFFFAFVRCYESNEWITISFGPNVLFVPFDVFSVFIRPVLTLCSNAPMNYSKTMFMSFQCSCCFFFYSPSQFYGWLQNVRIFTMNGFTRRYLHVQRVSNNQMQKRNCSSVLHSFWNS